MLIVPVQEAAQYWSSRTYGAVWVMLEEIIRPSLMADAEAVTGAPVPVNGSIKVPTPRPRSLLQPISALRPPVLNTALDMGAAWAVTAASPRAASQTTMR